MSLLMGTILVKRLKIQGIIIFDDYGHRYNEFVKEMSQWLSTGQIKYREHLIDGFENPPNALSACWMVKTSGNWLSGLMTNTNQSFKKGPFL